MQRSISFRRPEGAKGREQSAPRRIHTVLLFGAAAGGFMGQLGFQELLIIFVIALLVFGPKKLPELGKSLGKGLREFKKATEDLKSNWEDQMKEIEEPIKETAKDLKNTGHDMTTAIEQAAADPAHTIHTEPTEPAVPKEKV
jgi:TatA/E family protein of Tat protein translocase